MLGPELGILDQRRGSRAMLMIYGSEYGKDGQIEKKGMATTTIPMQFNPKEYQVQAQAQWRNDADHVGGVGQYQGTQPFKVSLEVFIDEPTRPMMEPACPPLIGQVDALLNCVHRSGGSESLPPVLAFSWGGRSFEAIATGVTARYSMFAHDGKPIRATCTLSLSVLPDTWPKQNPTSGTPKIDRAHRVVLGDTLASIAYDKYGDPTLWRAIAGANRIDDPSNLRLGEYVIVPVRSDAERMR